MDGLAQPFLGAVPALIVSYGPVDAVQAMGLRVELTDAQLVARCRTGDPDAWRELVDRFSRYVYAIAVQGFKLPEHDPAAFDPSTARNVLDAGPDEALKDTVVHPSADGWEMWVCLHQVADPEQADAMTTLHATSDDGGATWKRC